MLIPTARRAAVESSCAAIIIDRSIVAPSSCGSSCSRARTCTAGWSTVVHRTTPQRPATAAHKNGRPGCHQRAKAEPPPARHAAAAACSSQLASALVLRPTACDRRHSHGLPASGGKGGGAVSKRSAAGDGACQRCSRASPDDSPVLIVRRAGGAASVERPAGDLARGLAEALHGWLLRGAGRTRVERWNAGRGVGAGELLGRGFNAAASPKCAAWPASRALQGVSKRYWGPRCGIGTPPWTHRRLHCPCPTGPSPWHPFWVPACFKAAAVPRHVCFLAAAGPQPPHLAQRRTPSGAPAAGRHRSHPAIYMQPAAGSS